MTGVAVYGDWAACVRSKQALKLQLKTRTGLNGCVQRRGAAAAFATSRNQTCKVEAFLYAKIQAIFRSGTTHALSIERKATLARLIATTSHASFIVGIGGVGNTWQGIFYASKRNGFDLLASSRSAFRS
jgi:hypothetical protein